MRALLLHICPYDQYSLPKDTHTDVRSNEYSIRASFSPWKAPAAHNEVKVISVSAFIRDRAIRVFEALTCPLASGLTVLFSLIQLFYIKAMPIKKLLHKGAEIFFSILVLCI